MGVEMPTSQGPRLLASPRRERDGYGHALDAVHSVALTLRIEPISAHSRLVTGAKSHNPAYKAIPGHAPGRQRRLLAQHDADPEQIRWVVL